MINEQEIEKLWQAFKVLDVDGNGAISTEELGEVMRSLGQNPTETGLRDLIKEIDVDLCHHYPGDSTRSNQRYAS